MTDFAARLDRVESALAIQRLAAEYCLGADRREPDRWASVWADDALWAAGDDDEHRFHGIDAIVAAVGVQWDTFLDMRHFTTNHVIDVPAGTAGGNAGGNADRATGDCDVIVYVLLADGSWLRGGGSYADEYVRTPSGWRFAVRAATRDFFLDPLPPGVGPPEGPGG